MFFEEFNLNYSARTRGRTVTESDIVVFSTMTGAYNSLFLNEEFSKKTQFGGRIAPGLLTASIATGLIYLLPKSPFENGFVALLNLTFSAKKSVKIGDTLELELKVKDLKEKEKTGIVILSSSVLNQRGEEVMVIEHTIMVNKNQIKP
jgi:acyl dehydratase